MENDPRLALGELSSQLLLCETPDRDDVERIGATLEQLQRACSDSQWATIASVASDFLRATTQDIEENLAALTAACAQLEKHLYADSGSGGEVYSPTPLSQLKSPAHSDDDDGSWGFDDDDEDTPPAEPALLPTEVERSSEEIENLADFYSEAMDAVDQNERILLTAGDGNLGQHDIGALFRSFHSIKGIAGFIGLTQPSKLAHRTESLLGVIRNGEIVAGQDIVDLLLESNQCMFTLVQSVRAALESGMSVPLDSSVDMLCDRIDLAAKRDGVVDNRITPHSPQKSPQKTTQAATRSPGGIVMRDTLKVDVERVDSLVEMVGEMVIVESMIAGDETLSHVRSPKLTGNLRQMAKITQDLQKIALRLRMVPVRALFTRTARMVRELARQCDKDIHLQAQGEGTEIDRHMVELLADPLLHIIRNAVDHGIELPHERKAADKPERGTLRISAYHESSNLVIEIADDGRGLDTNALLTRGRERGLVADGQILSDDETFNLIFEPGFSTSESVNDISGRGVGMDVVRKNIKAMRGRISITSRPGEGTTFRLVLPLTLAIINGTLISCGGETYIVPTLSIIESMQPTASMIRNPCSSGELLQLRGKTYPLHRLADLLDIEGAQENVALAHAVLIESVSESFALLVDNVVSQQQVVIKRLEQRIRNRAFSGAAILSDGRIGLIINVDEITALSEKQQVREVA